MKRMISIGLALLFLLQVFTGLQFADESRNISDAPSLQAEIQDNIPVTRTRNENGLVAQWHFNEDSGDTVRDSSGNDNHGTLKVGEGDDVNSKWVKGIRGSAIQFDGEDDYVDCGNDSSLNVGINDATLEVWLKTTDNSQVSLIVTNRNSASGSSQGIQIFMNYGDIRIGLSDGSGNAIATPTGIAVNDNIWHHIVGVFDRDGDAVLYKDGLCVGSVDISSKQGNIVNNYRYTIGMGMRLESMGLPFIGTIDETRLYNRALSPEEILQHYISINHTEQDEFGGSWFDDFEDESGIENGLNERLVSDEHTVGLWHFDEGSGNNALDVSEYQNHGELINMDEEAWVQGKSETGLDFNGIDSYVDCGNDASLNITNSITVESWIYLRSNSGMNRILSKHDGYGYGLGIQNGEISFVLLGLWSETSTTANIMENNWYHIAVTYNRQIVKLYMNGVVIHESNRNDEIPSSLANLNIGRTENVGQYFDGIIDEVRISNIARTNEEIRRNYEGGLVLRNGRVELNCWKYKREINISNPGGVLIDYQIQVDITSQNFDYSHAMNDGSDLRFYGQDGRKLNYWIEEWNTNGQSRIWVKVPNIPNGESKIWMDYGNQIAESESDGAKTFIVFDNFEDGSLNYWSQYSEDGANTAIVTGDNGDGYWARFNSGNGYWSTSIFKSNFLKEEIVVDARYLSKNATYGCTGDCNGFGVYIYKSGVGRAGDYGTPLHPRIFMKYDLHQGDYQINQRDGTGKIINNAEGSGVTAGTWYDFKAVFGPTLRLYQGGIEKISIARDSTTWADIGSNMNIEWSHSDYTGTSSYSGIDNIRIRKYSSSEPITSFGAEYQAPIPYFKSKSIPLPSKMKWSTFSITKTEPIDTHINISIINTTTNQIIVGFDNLTARNIDMSNITANSIRLKAYFSGDGPNTPTLDSWGVEWVAENAWRDSFTGDSKVAYPYGIDENTVGYWRFEEGSGNIAWDLSGNGNDGAIIGAEWTDGRINNGLIYEKESDCVEIADENLLEFKNYDFSISLWFRPNNTQSGGLIGHWGSDADHSIWMSIYDSKLRFMGDEIGTGTAVDLIGGTIIRNNWHYATITRFEENFSLSLDGIIIDTYNWNGSFKDIDSNWTIGRIAWDHSNIHFNGIIDEVRISNISRTPEEIRQAYQAGVAIHGRQVRLGDNEIVPDRNTSALWHLNEGEGNVLYDSSGNGNDGILYGANWTEGVMRKALDFDGEKDYIEINTSSLKNVFNPGSKFSIEFWFNPRELPSQWQWLFSKAYLSHIPPYYQLYIRYSNDRKITAHVHKNDAGAYLIATSSNTFELGKWHHIVLTVDLSINNLYLYANGKLVGNDTSPSGSYTNWDSPITIGRNKNTISNTYDFKGLIDEVAIYNRALTPSEIYNHSRLYRYNATLRSETIQLPDDYTWDTFHFSRSVPDTTYLNISVHDAVTNELLLMDTRNTNGEYLNLSSINALEHPSIYHQAYFQSDRTKTPLLYDWAVNWSYKLQEEAPILIEKIKDIEILEDTTGENILDLSTCFSDIYSHIKAPTYTIEYISDKINITVQLDGSVLNVSDLAENWTGNVSVIVNCTNHYDLTTSSNMFNITVLNVNDAPHAVLLSPENGAILDDANVTLSWQGFDVDSNLTSLTYDLYLSQSQEPELHSTGLTETNITISHLEKGMTYFWFIIPRDPELEGVCLNGTWNFTIDVRGTSTDVLLHSPLNGTTLNSTEVNLTWGVWNATDESSIFHIYMGATEDNLLEVGTTTDTWYLLSDLDINTIYYWYVLPSEGDSFGKCSSGVWYFSIDPSFEAVYNISVELDVDRLEIIRGNNSIFNITLTNNGNIPTLVNLSPYGPISGFVNISRAITLPIDSSRIIPVTITNISSLIDDSYELSIEIAHPGGTETIIIPVNITSWMPTSGDDDADDDVPGKDENSPKSSGNKMLFIVLGILLVAIIIAMVIFLLMKRRKRDRLAGEGKFSVMSRTDSPNIGIPSQPAVPPQQYYTNYQYSQPPPIYESPPAQPSEPVYPADESSVSPETIPDFQPKYPSDDYSTEHSEPVPESIPQPFDEKAQSIIFKTYEAVQCGICLGYIKNGAQAFKCVCGKIFHPTCGARTGKCPICQRTITKEDVGLLEEDIPPERAIPKVIPVEEPLNVSCRNDPRILGASEDFNISDTFLISLNGLLIRSLSFGTSVRDGTDQDIMTGMLTAVTDFIKDSFRDELGGLKTLQYGRMTIYLERGVTFYLVTVFRGEPLEDLRKRMRNALIQLWEKYKHYLKAWDGTLDGLEGIDNCLMESLGLQSPETDTPQSEDDSYQPPKFTGDIFTSVPGEGEMPNVVTTADLSTQQGCYHLYNMLLAKKGSDIRIGLESPKEDIGKARKQIIMMYHPDRWQTDSDKANFFMKKVNVAWEVLSSRP